MSKKRSPKGKGSARSKKTKQDKKRAAKEPKQARLADKYACYEAAVQSPEADVPLLNKIFKSAYGRKPETLREDFCGTALLCCEFVKLNRDNKAIGVDLDAPGRAGC